MKFRNFIEQISMKHALAIINKVERYFVHFDAKINRLKKKYKIDCAIGCGKCCDNENIEATVLEMLPVAFELLHKNEKSCIKLSEKIKKSRICFNYSQKAINGSHCLHYQKRGFICRAFGFTVTKTKNGKLELISCSYIKDLKKLHDVSEFQEITAEFQKFKNIEHGLSEYRYPINTAIIKAMEVLWYPLFYKIS